MACFCLKINNSSFAGVDTVNEGTVFVGNPLKRKIDGYLNFYTSEIRNFSYRYLRLRT